ncbi:growth arrest-specific protein 2-like [Montipora capricornis]|uniref:growth arrest-specific protein 2-like n=1 Tax=Montipora foliosa TaxID=591990 RepID=UPI0035F11D3C
MGQEGDLDFTMKIAERSEQDLLPLKEDLAEWLSRVLQENITADNFMDRLENGVLVCKLAQIVQRTSQDSSKTGKAVKPLAPFAVKFHQNAKAGTFFARDNAAHFLQWCRQIEVQDSVLFESDGLVLQKQPREVILCLLDVARKAADFGIEPPKLIKLEKEIDDEIAAEEAKKPELKPAKKAKKVSKATSIDAEVARLAAKYGVSIERIKEGRYIVDGKINIFVRILRNHVMVRVGGGWDTLEHFISRHDPNKIGRILTSTPQTCTHHHHHHHHQLAGVACSAST